MSAKTSKSKKTIQPKIDSSFTLKKIEPITDSQKDVIETFDNGSNLVLMGTAGTGKTFLSLYLSLNEIMRGKGVRPQKITIVRSIVSTRDIGFLPGTIKEKMAVYEEPYRAIFSELFERGDAYEVLKTKGVVEFCSTSYLRGTTINDSYIILDEFQNCTFQEIDTVISRIGKNSKIIVCGDIMQTDLNKSKWDVTGLPDFVNIVEKMEEFEIIDFGIEDIVRSGLVKSYILAKKNYFEYESEKVDKTLLQESKYSIIKVE